MAASAHPSRPLDRALHHLLDGAPERALTDLLPLIEQRREVAALMAAGEALVRCASEHDVKEAAERVLRAAAKAAIRIHSFGLAVAACSALEQLECSVESEFDELATAFSRLPEGAPRAVPPELQEELPAPPDDLPFNSLVERVVAASEEVAAGPLSVASPGATELLCAKLGPDDLRAFARILRARVFGVGQVIIQEGQPGRAAYFLARGELEVVREPSGRSGRGEEEQKPLVLARLGAGSLFGEMALLSRSPRAASVIAVRPSIVLRGSKRALDEVAEKNPRLGKALAAFCRRRMIDNLVRTSEVLKPLRAAQREALLDRFRPRTFETGEVVIAEGQEGAGLHLVASGSFSVVAGQGEDTTLLATLRTGEVVGEVGLVLRRPATAAVRADCPSVTLHLPADEFLSVIKQHPELLAELYELAVEREDETRSLLAQQAHDASDQVLF